MIFRIYLCLGRGLLVVEQKLTKKKNKHEKTASCRKKGQFETNLCFKQQKENHLVITKKNNEPTQNLTEIVVGE